MERRKSNGLLGRGILAAVMSVAPLPLAADAPHASDERVAQQGSASDLSSARAELGRKLFFDPILSSDRSISCASCHKPEHAFADNTPVSKGVGGALGTRNTPSVMNSTGRVSFFWDGRARSLETQAIFPIENPVEMNLPIEQALARINADAAYASEFGRLYGGPATAKSLGAALAAFQKTLETANTPYDRYQLGDDDALSPAARRGRLLFIGKANCATCHSGEDFTSDRFENIGLYNGKNLNDRGRAEVTGLPQDEGMFKVPTLRNVALTAPYMHNGMFATLREVIEYYNDPDRHVSDSINRDAKLDKPLNLTEAEIDDLVAFLESLTDDRFRINVHSAAHKSGEIRGQLKPAAK
jgi:cytochrome c peroxidase